MPPPRPKLEAEAFEGESSLSEDETNRLFVLHFAIPRTIMTCDMVEGRSTEEELNDVLSSMAWGSINEAREWILESEEPSVSHPDRSLITYSEYTERKYPASQSGDAEENLRTAALLRCAFTNPGEPGERFRPMFDLMVKSVSITSKSVMKAFGIQKVVLNENEPDDPEKDEIQNLVRFGRQQVIPSFFALLAHLTRMRVRFLVVFRAFGPELPVVQRELKYVCQGQHPALKSQKLPPMNGEKGSRDMMLKDEYIGRFDRAGGCLEFPGRSASRAEASEETLEFVPTKYEFPPYHKAYAGLMHHILEEVNTAAIVDDLEYWKDHGRVASAGKPLLVDWAGGFAETKVQHIFFDGHMRLDDAHCVDVRDVVSGEPIPFEVADKVFLHRTNFFHAVVDPDYYIKALEECRLNMSKCIVESRRVPGHVEKPTREMLKALPPKEYLYRTVIPALLPALEQCQRIRPPDPIEFIAFYMLRHPQGYNKTIQP